MEFNNRWLSLYWYKTKVSLYLYSINSLGYLGNYGSIDPEVLSLCYNICSRSCPFEVLLDYIRDFPERWKRYYYANNTPISEAADTIAKELNSIVS